MPSLLFSNQSFSMTIGEPFHTLPDNTSTIHKSRFGTGTAALHTPSLAALKKYCSLMAASEAGSSTDDLGAIGEQNPTYLLAEYPNSNGGLDLVAYVIESGNFVISRYENLALTAYELRPGEPGKMTGAALLFCLMPKFMEEAEFAEKFALFYEESKNGFPDPIKAYEYAFVLCDNMRCRIDNQNIPEKVLCSISNTGNITQMTQAALDRGVYGHTSELYGKFTQLGRSTGAGAAPKFISSNGFAGKYQLACENASVVLDIPEWYLLPEEADVICRHIFETSASWRPIRNIMLRGPAGTGKTEMCKVIAAGLGLPYSNLTCSSGTDMGQLGGQFVPATSGMPNSIVLPSIEDITYDPSGTYERLTGKEVEDIETEMLLEAVLKAAGQTGTKEGHFQYVESPLIHTARYGGVCELQEVSAIADPAVLVGLNSLLDGGGTIQLETGETVRRHPNAVFILTTNPGYEGTRNMNQSMLSRMQIVFDYDALTAEIMAERAKKVTGFSDDVILMKMARATLEMAELCREHMITDGSVGMRELIDWVQSTSILNDAKRAAGMTILPSATAESEDRALLSQIIEAYF